MAAADMPTGGEPYEDCRVKSTSATIEAMLERAAAGVESASNTILAMLEHAAAASPGQAAAVVPLR